MVMTRQSEERWDASSPLPAAPPPGNRRRALPREIPDTMLLFFLRKAGEQSAVFTLQVGVSPER